MTQAPKPLSDSAILSLAMSALSGGSIGGDISREDAIKIFGVALGIRQKEAAIAKARTFIEAGTLPEDVPGMVGRIPMIGKTSIPAPDEMIAEILATPEFQALLQMLAALAYADLPFARPRSEGGYGSSLDQSPELAANDLIEYLRHTRLGDPITGGLSRGIPTHRDYPATYEPAKARRLWIRLRIWANTLPVDQVGGWLDRRRLSRQIGHLVEVGETLRKTWSIPMERLGRPIEAVYLVPPFLSLPAYPYPVLESDLGLPPPIPAIKPSTERPHFIAGSKEGKS